MSAERDTEEANEGETEEIELNQTKVLLYVHVSTVGNRYCMSLRIHERITKTLE